ncbi:hypothetical protein MMC14_009698 [Varicellaria rhodocarpa]|nr:hypothetical protein [Varicellaria rhodocarpa]
MAASCPLRNNWYDTSEGLIPLRYCPSGLSISLPLETWPRSFSDERFLLFLGLGEQTSRTYSLHVGSPANRDECLIELTPYIPERSSDSTAERSKTVKDGKEVTESKDQSLHPGDEKNAVVKDLEKGSPAGEQPRTETPRDPNLVSWDGPNDPNNPKNWTRGKKWTATIIVATYAFISPLSSTMIAPALGAIAKAFDISSAVESQISLSIFLLAYALGPFFLGPMSEIFGRAVML